MNDVAPVTLGWLLERLETSERDYAASLRDADQMEATRGRYAGRFTRIFAERDRFRPDPATMPGVDRIVLACDELENSPGLTPANVARLRAQVCRAKPCSLAEASALTLGEAADVLDEALRHATKGEIDAPKQAAPRPVAAPRGTKRGTTRGEARAKLIAALTKHHRYSDGGCLNLEPVGNNELARMGEVAKRTASAFFSKEFQGHGKYRALCRDAGSLAAALKLLNGEFAPHVLYGGGRPTNTNRDDE